jgi:hypothetical protein
MKNINTFLLPIMQALMLASSLLLVAAFCDISDGKIEPVGAKRGTVQFDAIIELNRYSPHSLRHDYTIIFARYWVACDYYSAAIVWAEPQLTGLVFNIYPPTLSFASDEQEFMISHELNTNYNEIYKKPFAKRGVLRHKFGSYPIDNIRFAELEALSERIYTSDLRVMVDANQAGGEVLDLSVPDTDCGYMRNISQLKIQINGDRIDSMQLFNADKRLLKDINYEYENTVGKNCIRKLTAVLPERPMMVGFNSKGIKVTLEGKEYQYRDLDAIYHGGGRTCIVDYEPVWLGDKDVTLPVKVIVRNRIDGRILRCVKMTNFKQVELDAAGAEKAAKQFGGFTSDQHKYWQLREKYWEKCPEQVEEVDIELIKQLLGRTEKDATVTDSSTGEKLKHLNILIELDRIVGDESEMKRNYQNYLSTLSDSKLAQMILVGGYGVIETSMFRQRQSEAEKLLDLWVKAALEINDDELMLFFAKSQLAKNRLWTTVKLLESLLNKKHCSDDIRFEAKALRCIALDELYKLVRSVDIAKKGLIAEIQANWVASIGKDNLNKMLDRSLDQAIRSFASLTKPTEYQQTLKKQLDKIVQDANLEKPVIQAKK